MKKDYKCVGGPMDGKVVSVDRDTITYNPDAPAPTREYAVATYTMRRDADSGEWFLEWDGDLKVLPK